MDTETYDGSAHWAHPVKDRDGDWVRYEDAQAEIARLLAEVSNLKNWIDHHGTEVPRLQSEVERLRKLTLTLSMERHVPAMRVADKMHKQQAQATDDYMALLDQLKTARNDALEEAATALRPMLRGMISRSEAARVIRELKGKP